MGIGETLPLWSIIPFVGMLLSIALLPLINASFWEKYRFPIALGWSLIFLIPFTFGYGIGETGFQLAEVVLLDYVPFIVLLLGLFVVAGGIKIKGTIAGTTKNNIILLVIGTILASWIGTTGAAMLMIRPVIRANTWRKRKAHVIIFFIFLVANMGGCLTPIGDPPLFLGYLRGIPFFWTLLNIWPILLLNTVLLIVVFLLIDRHLVKKERAEGRHPEDLLGHAVIKTPIQIEGAHNFIFLALIILAVILNGYLPQVAALINPETELIFGIELMPHINLGLNYFIQIALILIATVLSLLTTKKVIRERNGFEWEPIKEVAELFIGIFITMIPALILLRTHGGSLGIETPLEFFWATGVLSSFLDNSPTYVVFLTTAGSLGALDGVASTAGVVTNMNLLAISAGAVFMGANSYIGNAPNFMIKTIAERNNIKMPSFFGYMGWAAVILIPLFIIDSLLFFL